MPPLRNFEVDVVHSSSGGGGDGSVASDASSESSVTLPKSLRPQKEMASEKDMSRFPGSPMPSNREQYQHWWDTHAVSPRNSLNGSSHVESEGSSHHAPPKAKRHLTSPSTSA